MKNWFFTIAIAIAVTCAYLIALGQNNIQPIGQISTLFFLFPSFPIPWWFEAGCVLLFTSHFIWDSQEERNITPRKYLVFFIVGVSAGCILSFYFHEVGIVVLLGFIVGIAFYFLNNGNVRKALESVETGKILNIFLPGFAFGFGIFSGFTIAGILLAFLLTVFVAGIHAAQMIHPIFEKTFGAVNE